MLALVISLGLICSSAGKIFVNAKRNLVGSYNIFLQRQSALVGSAGPQPMGLQQEDAPQEHR